MTKGVKDETKKVTLVYRGHVSPPHVDAAAFVAATELWGSPEKLLAGLEELLLAGVVIKLTPSVNGERVYAEFGGGESANPDKRGYYLSSFGGTLISSLCVALYRNFTMLENDWPTGEGTEYG